MFECTGLRTCKVMGESRVLPSLVILRGSQQFLPNQHNPTIRIQQTRAPLPPYLAPFRSSLGRSGRWVVLCW